MSHYDRLQGYEELCKLFVLPVKIDKPVIYVLLDVVMHADGIIV
jgi:hypothetical protein